MDENFRFLSGYHPDFFVTALIFGNLPLGYTFLIHVIDYQDIYFIYCDLKFLRSK